MSFRVKIKDQPRRILQPNLIWSLREEEPLETFFKHPCQRVFIGKCLSSKIMRSLY